MAAKWAADHFMDRERKTKPTFRKDSLASDACVSTRFFYWRNVCVTACGYAWKGCARKINVHFYFSHSSSRRNKWEKVNKEVGSRVTLALARGNVTVRHPIRLVLGNTCAFTRWSDLNARRRHARVTTQLLFNSKLSKLVVSVYTLLYKRKNEEASPLSLSLSLSDPTVSLQLLSRLRSIEICWWEGPAIMWVVDQESWDLAVFNASFSMRLCPECSAASLAHLLSP